MPDDKLAVTLAALARGERPPCPWCGSVLSLASEKLWAWGCAFHASTERTGYVRFTRAKDCYERQLAAQDAVVQQQAGEIARLRAALAELRKVLESIHDIADGEICACEDHDHMADIMGLAYNALEATAPSPDGKEQSE